MTNPITNLILWCQLSTLLMFKYAYMFGIGHTYLGFSIHTSNSVLTYGFCFTFSQMSPYPHLVSVAVQLGGFFIQPTWMMDIYGDVTIALILENPQQLATTTTKSWNSG